MSLACWCYFIDEQWPHPPLKVVVMTTHQSCRLTTPVGLMLLTCGLGPHSQRVGQWIAWMAEKLKHLARLTLSLSWVFNDRFGFPLRYKQ
jgi:hypothetical protein